MPKYFYKYLKTNLSKIDLALTLLGSIYPWHCRICGEQTQNQGFCDACQRYLPWIGGNDHCRICSLPLKLNRGKDLICGQCQKIPPYYYQLNSAFWYEAPIDDLITELKYFKCWENAQTLVELTKQNFLDSCADTLVVPTPSHPIRVKQRGFNVAYELIKLFKQGHSFESDNTLVNRVINTEPQMGKNKTERKKNVHKVFCANKTLSNKHITIVDDVVTTGATVNELSRCLKNAGAEKISVWTIARTRVRDN